MNTEKAILAGGCFWGMEDLIRHLPGVIDTTVGYTGGHTLNPTYEIMKSSVTGHAEAIEVVFDPAVLSYRKLLEFFFQIHDPTTPNQQGNDIGPSYRSAIFYLTPQQKIVAEDLLAEMAKTGIWPGRIVTEVTAAKPFYKAETYHQDYLKQNPNGYTCHYIRKHWAMEPQQKRAS
jgi:peptide-methionine (S)-S-oxide reductase